MSIKSITSSVKSTVKSLTRREALKGMLNFAWAVPLAASVAELLRYMRFEPPAAQATRFTLGAPASLPELPVYIEEAQVWLHKDGAGFYAVDGICTHLGCTVNLQSDGTYYCPCHSSRFAQDGTVMHGPATLPLPFVKLSWSSDGQLVVDRAEQVEPDFRLPAS
jgi:nitrite reductase/ring-hydroxylating ferredoxin subunit